KEEGVDSKIELYLSISNKPNFSKIEKKLKANPKGFMTQVIQTIEQVQNLADNLKGYSLIPIVLYPSEKNEASAKFLNLDLTKYRETFDEFLKQIQQITGDVLITSPNDFSGLKNFLENKTI
ncbi:MAG: 5,10-methenyltetrahydrofolate synthetase, partial [Nitrosopumilus sp.]|nr:5,10-methenyltetrahydrofolate synthetase [Nitrosopumilus sp.]